MCVAPPEPWPELVSLVLLCHRRDSEGLRGPWRRFLVSGNSNRCQKCALVICSVSALSDGASATRTLPGLWWIPGHPPA